MLKKRWSNLDMVIILVIISWTPLLVYYLGNNEIRKKITENKAKYDLATSHSDIYGGMALPDEMLENDYQKDIQKAKMLLTEKEGYIWSYFHTEKVMGHKVFVFRLSPSKIAE